jgi:hypothetical protein
LTVKTEAIGLEYVNSDDLALSGISFQFRNPSDVYFVPTTRPSNDGGYISVVGVFRFDISGEGGFQFLPKIQQFEVVIPPGDVLKSHVVSNLVTKTLMISPGGIGALLVEGSSGLKNSRILSFRDFDEQADPTDEELTDIIRENVSVRMFIWNSNSDSDVLFDGTALKGLGIPGLGRPKSFVTSLGEHVIEQDQFRIVLEVQPEIDPQEIGIESPLRACIEDRDVDPILKCRLEESDIRVAMEDYYFKFFDSWNDSSSAMKSCGHIVVSSDKAENLEVLVPSSSGAVMHSSEMNGNQVWPLDRKSVV